MTYMYRDLEAHAGPDDGDDAEDVNNEDDEVDEVDEVVDDDQLSVEEFDDNIMEDVGY